jgi:hypothetical protein
MASRLMLTRSTLPVGGLFGRVCACTHQTVSWQGSASLKSFFQLLSTNVDRKGKAFVSSVEAFNFPIYATQWHPERPQFDWTPTENIVRLTPPSVFPL